MGLRNDTRQKNTQIILDFYSAPTGGARSVRVEETEPFPAEHAPERPASTNQLMEEVCERENLKQAFQQVKANKGSPGIDGMTVEELPGYLQQHWPVIRKTNY
jgi:RNA-directed DNA polymerase